MLWLVLTAWLFARVAAVLAGAWLALVGRLLGTSVLPAALLAIASATLLHMAYGPSKLLHSDQATRTGRMLSAVDMARGASYPLLLAALAALLWPGAAWGPCALCVLVTESLVDLAWNLWSRVSSVPAGLHTPQPSCIPAGLRAPQP